MTNQDIVIVILAFLVIVLSIGNAVHVWIHRKSIDDIVRLRRLIGTREAALKAFSSPYHWSTRWSRDNGDATYLVWIHPDMKDPMEFARKTLEENR